MNSWSGLCLENLCAFCELAMLKDACLYTLCILSMSASTHKKLHESQRSAAKNTFLYRGFRDEIQL